MPEFVAIVGSRTLPRQAWPWMKECLDTELAGVEVAAFFSGGARGADRMAERYVWQLHNPWSADGRWAVIRDFPGFTIDHATARGFILVVLPNYGQYGKRAPLVRNEAIASVATRLIAFVNGKMSSGTGHVVGAASRLGLTVSVHTWTGG